MSRPTPGSVFVVISDQLLQHVIVNSADGRKQRTLVKGGMKTLKPKCLALVSQFFHAPHAFSYSHFSLRIRGAGKTDPSLFYTCAQREIFIKSLSKVERPQWTRKGDGRTERGMVCASVGSSFVCLS